MVHHSSGGSFGGAPAPGQPEAAPAGGHHSPDLRGGGGRAASRAGAAR